MPSSVRSSSIFDGRSHSSVVIYQNTSGSTNLPKTFGLTPERLLVLADRCAADSNERRVSAQARSKSTPTASIA